MEAGITLCYHVQNSNFLTEIHRRHIIHLDTSFVKDNSSEDET